MINFKMLINSFQKITNTFQGNKLENISSADIIQTMFVLSPFPSTKEKKKKEKRKTRLII